MARKASSTISQEELYPQADEPARQELDDARLLDLDVDDESPFLRAQKRVSVRRSALPKKTATHLTWAALVVTIVLVCGLAVSGLYHYGEHSWRFRIESSDDIEITGLGNVTRPQVVEVMGEDIGRNIFFVPLETRQRQLEQIPWVESASVMRFVPNRLSIEIHERTPVAFVRIGSKIQLIDAGGTLMDLPVTGKKKFSFPVILGMNAGEPLSSRAPRMKIYNELLRELDSEGAHYSQDLSEVDLSDSDDVKVLANDPGGEALVHLGSSDFLNRFKIYISHVQEWRQQFAHLDSIDLRYDRQIVVNPDLQGVAKEPPLSKPVAKAAAAAGVKQAALVTHERSAKLASGSAHRPAASLASSRKATSRAHPAKSVQPKTSGKAQPANSAVAVSHVPQSTTSVAPVPAAPPAATTNSNTTKPQKPSAGIPKGQQ